MKKFKVGLVGAGGVTELHLEGYKGKPDRIEVVAICDPNEDNLRYRAEKYGIPNTFTDLDAFIRDSGIDVAVVCTPTSIRKQVVMPLLDAGIPVFVEKPFSDTLADAVEITEKAKRLGIPVAVNQNFRRHFPFDVARRLVDGDAIGKVTSIQFNQMFFREDAGWRLDCERHALSVMGIHWFDGFRQTLGCEAESVTSLMSSSDAIGCRGETDATVQIQFENGAFVTYTQSFSSAVNRTEMIVIGERGTLICNHHSVQLHRVGDREPSERWIVDVSRETNSLENVGQLLDWIETGVPAPNSAEDNLNVVAMLDAAYVSAGEKRTVQLKKAGSACL
ncbi:Gfo/Idh/MocA family protein [Paenibacillus arenilitoris]|uniref:Gfo/Idh/MocA family oxidoreductase n=1 Tax=Paenibacillus arenilitoris TaxID=2772299 RepID=A0A927CFU7_9BACL|nr:Gfo/Idh/MocA family oxidoreductase [Paenibacillus arenilitoris]MBD2867313.1 Gfo/Idh/MocA family oxidoreductase [Paenibacillus arenilitoris]